MTLNDAEWWRWCAQFYSFRYKQIKAMIRNTAPWFRIIPVKSDSYYQECRSARLLAVLLKCPSCLNCLLLLHQEMAKLPCDFWWRICDFHVHFWPSDQRHAHAYSHCMKIWPKGHKCEDCWKCCECWMYVLLRRWKLLQPTNRQNKYLNCSRNYKYMCRCSIHLEFHSPP